MKIIPFCLFRILLANLFKVLRSTFRISFIFLPSSFILLLVGCSSTSNQPVVVNVTEVPVQGGRYRAAERQRDVWIAPQAIDNEVLQHEQMVTFVEKPMSWKLPSTMEPNTVSPPSLPLEEGEYDAEVVKRQKEIIADAQQQMKKLTNEMEKIRIEASTQVTETTLRLEEKAKELQITRQQLDIARQKFNDIDAAEKLRLKQEEERKKKKSRWNFW